MLITLDSANLGDDRLLIEKELHRIIADERSYNGPLVFECMNYAVFTGGKRIRPLLGLQVARAFNDRPTTCLPYLAAVELLHTASLIIDDLPCMDNQILRRSQPSAHLQCGEGVAILSAVALVVLSTRLALTRDDGARQSKVYFFQSMLLDSIGRSGLISGQEQDLTHKSSGQTVYSKTSPLFELACAAGLVCSDLADEAQAGIIQFGRNYGRAFQTVDDVLDGGCTESWEASREIAECADSLHRLQTRYPKLHCLHTFVDWLSSHNLKSTAAER